MLKDRMDVKKAGPRECKKPINNGKLIPWIKSPSQNFLNVTGTQNYPTSEESWQNRKMHRPYVA